MNLANRGALLKEWREGDKGEVLKEAFPDRAERTFVMDLVQAVAEEHQFMAKLARWFWITVGVTATLAFGVAVQVFA